MVPKKSALFSVHRMLIPMFLEISKKYDIKQTANGEMENEELNIFEMVALFVDENRQADCERRCIKVFIVFIKCLNLGLVLERQIVTVFVCAPSFITSRSCDERQNLNVDDPKKL